MLHLIRNVHDMRIDRREKIIRTDTFENSFLVVIIIIIVMREYKSTP
jgi:hypothetical protein